MDDQPVSSGKGCLIWAVLVPGWMLLLPGLAQLILVACYATRGIQIDSTAFAALRGPVYAIVGALCAVIFGAGALIWEAKRAGLILIVAAVVLLGLCLGGTAWVGIVGG
jgi:hypothetical protein